jgi:Protein of unknown function (DUF3500)
VRGVIRYSKEKPVNGSIQQAQPASKRGGRKSLAMLATVLLVGGTLYVSRSALPTAPADDPKENKTAAPTPDAVMAANRFLGALPPEQREKALYEFGSAKKSKWSNLPVTFVPRNGVRLGDLTKEQRALAMDVVAAVLSKSGYQKVVDIMDGDQRLADNEERGGKGGGKGRGPLFGADQYYLAIFGKPSEKEAWMVQFGGHHLGVNVTVIGKNFVLTPTHTGAQPALFKRGNNDVRPLGQENDAAFKLVNALDEKQRAQAIVGKRPQQDLLLGPGRDGKTIDPQGIKGSALSDDQQAMLLDVISAWVNIVESDAAAKRMAEIKEKIGETYFAWKGPTEKGSAVYFRVQGPTVVIEYAPQGNTDHIHTVIRNPKDDYGAALLER